MSGLQLNNLYPGVKVIMVEWPVTMLTAYDASSPSSSENFSILASPMFEVYQSYHQAAFKNAMASGISNLFYFAPSERVGSFPRGCIGHPSVQSDKAIADELLPFLKGVMGW